MAFVVEAIFFSLLQISLFVLYPPSSLVIYPFGDKKKTSFVLFDELMVPVARESGEGV